MKLIDILNLQHNDVVIYKEKFITEKLTFVKNDIKIGFIFNDVFLEIFSLHKDYMAIQNNELWIIDYDNLKKQIEIF